MSAMDGPAGQGLGPGGTGLGGASGTLEALTEASGSEPRQAELPTVGKAGRWEGWLDPANGGWREEGHERALHTVLVQENFPTTRMI